MKKFVVALMVAMSVMFGSEPVKAFAVTAPDMVQASDADVRMEHMEEVIVRKWVWMINRYPYHNCKVIRVGHGIMEDGSLSITIKATVDGEEVVEHAKLSYDEAHEMFDNLNVRYALARLNLWCE